MRVKAATVQKFLLGIALLAALAWNLAHASEIKGLELSAGATGTRAEIALDGAGEFKVISLKDPTAWSSTCRLRRLARNFSLPASAGVVKSVRTGQPAPGTSRIVFDLSAAGRPCSSRASSRAATARGWCWNGRATAPRRPHRDAAAVRPRRSDAAGVDAGDASRRGIRASAAVPPSCPIDDRAGTALDADRCLALPRPRA